MNELELFGKVLLAGFLGYVIGLERELMGSSAGDRTFSLVSLGSALFTALSFDVFGAGDNDPGRVAANVLTGVGFLGGGMILKEGGTVRGLTTAAGIWLAAAIGIAVGYGRLGTATVATLLALVILGVLWRLEERIEARDTPG